MKLVLLGAGGHARACADVAMRAGCTVMGVVTPMEEFLEGCIWLGPDSWLNNKERHLECSFLVAVGQVSIDRTRARLYELLVEKSLPIATLIARSAVVSPTARIGLGTVAMEQSFIGAGALVGHNCIVNTSAIVEHDAKLGNHCHVSTGAVVNGGCCIGDGAMIGSGAVLVQEVRICSGAMVAAGAVVTSNIAEPGKWAGIPARRIG